MKHHSDAQDIYTRIMLYAVYSMHVMLASLCSIYLRRNDLIFLARAVLSRQNVGIHSWCKCFVRVSGYLEFHVRLLRDDFGLGSPYGCIVAGLRHPFEENTVRY